MYEICKSLIDMGLDKIMILNGHGNNPGALDVGTRKMGDDFDVPMGIVNIFSLWDKDYINNNRKSKEGSIGKILYLSTWFIEESKYGGAGDPSDARKDFGEKIHRSSVETLDKVIEEFYDFQLSYKKRGRNK